ncbi:nitrogen fixation protein NifQ [Geoalkalibacter sp.]|uniref:nitrogen fixation protein NifQ n=1 Tax=Geoalkalibacter sp. TaxID=3041440 RepID=UPI00272EBEB4|nr:nitrogen fixation protein NifQ [Geoalkalibacter sp.]
MAEYTECIRRWAADTSQSGSLEDADGIGEVGLGEEHAGKRLAVRFALRIREHRIDDVRYQVFGCGFTLAACAATAHLAKGADVAQAQKLSAAKIDALLEGLPAERSYCAELANEAFQAALAAARTKTGTLRRSLHHPPHEDARVSTGDPVYQMLMAGEAPQSVPCEDRHLFACLLAAAAQENPLPAVALGWSEFELKGVLTLCFPALDPARLRDLCPPIARPLPAPNEALLPLLLSYLRQQGDKQRSEIALWLAKAIAARSAHPGHLWVAMGLFKRPELTAAIRRHLPALAAANHQGMRWKRFLFKQLCDLQGGLLCPSPECGLCSDYPLCFPSEEPRQSAG